MHIEVTAPNCSISFELAARRLSINRRALDLTTAEYDILTCLVGQAGQVVSRDTLTRVAFGREFHPADRAVDVHISHLRKKLGRERALIVTVRHAGYLFRAALCALFLAAGTASAAAQTEDIEPRAIGGAGVMTIGISGFIDKFMSTEEVFPWQATVNVDFTRFLTRRFAVRGGLIGSGRFGGDEDESEGDTGPGASALHAHGGLLYYFTPDALASVYAGGEYRAQLTNRADEDAGTVLGKGGLEAAISSRVRLFVEGGYGMRLTRGPDDERQTRLVGELGVRVKFR